jgi:hypothetical protein
MVDSVEERVGCVGTNNRLGLRRLESRRRECRLGTGRIASNSAGARGWLSRQSAGGLRDRLGRMLYRAHGRSSRLSRRERHRDHDGLNDLSGRYDHDRRGRQRRRCVLRLERRRALRILRLDLRRGDPARRRRWGLELSTRRHRLRRSLAGLIRWSHVPGRLRHVERRTWSLGLGRGRDVLLRYRLLVQRRWYRLLLLLLLLLSELRLVLHRHRCRSHLEALLLRHLTVGGTVCRLWLSEWLTRLYHWCLLQHCSGEGLDGVHRDGR